MKISTLKIGIVPAIALLLAGILVGALLPLPPLGDAANRSQAEQAARTAVLAETATNSEERIWKLYRERESLLAQLKAAESSSAVETSAAETPAAEASAAPTAPSAPGVFTDGIHIVGADIKPGTYDGRVSGSGPGYWARLKSTDGTVNSIITNGIAEGPFVLTLTQTDRAVELRGVTLTVRD